jgi:hypothetical protein
VIRPRGELLQERFRGFDLWEAFSTSDSEFCKQWGISENQLKKQKEKYEAKGTNEKDVLWTYIMNH